MSARIIDCAKLLVFSDLDGTLLDHYSYSYQAACPSLETLAKAGVPVILNTSKTAAEVQVIHKQLALNTPFIIENGAAVFIPKTAFKAKPKDTVWQNGFWVKTFSSKRAHWTELINRLAVNFAGQFETFSQMSLNRLCEVTGLDEMSAKHAADRLYGEPILWKGSEQQQISFVEQAEKLGAFVLHGGRFLHISGDANKGKALSWLTKEYERQWQKKPLTTIALGDGKNDIAMLEAADIAVRILSPVNPPPELNRSEGVFTSTLTGPEGWHEMIEQLIGSMKER
jgi:mannosyl-3-phosphoglycerate phosphatase